MRRPARRQQSVATLALMVLSASLASCKRDSNVTSTRNLESVDSAPAARPSASSASRTGRGTVPKHPPPCRALAVRGQVLGAHSQLKTRQAVDGATWLKLASGAQVTIHHGRSAREYRLEGPAWALPCMGGKERVLLRSGVFKSNVGNGDRAGVEVEVITTLGWIAYARARLEVKATEQLVEVKVDSGTARAQNSAIARRVGPEGVAAKKSATLKRSTEASFSMLLEDCTQRADASYTAAQALFRASRSDNKREMMSSHVAVRQHAELACSVAELAEASLAAKEQSEWSSALKAAQERFRRIPAPTKPDVR